MREREREENEHTPGATVSQEVHSTPCGTGLGLCCAMVCWSCAVAATAGPGVPLGLSAGRCPWLLVAAATNAAPAGTHLLFCSTAAARPWSSGVFAAAHWSTLLPSALGCFVHVCAAARWTLGGAAQRRSAKGAGIWRVERQQLGSRNSRNRWRLSCALDPQLAAAGSCWPWLNLRAGLFLASESGAGARWDCQRDLSAGSGVTCYGFATVITLWNAQFLAPPAELQLTAWCPSCLLFSHVAAGTFWPDILLFSSPSACLSTPFPS